MNGMLPQQCLQGLVVTLQVTLQAGHSRSCSVHQHDFRAKTLLLWLRQVAQVFPQLLVDSIALWDDHVQRALQQRLSYGQPGKPARQSRQPTLTQASRFST